MKRLLTIIFALAMTTGAFAQKMWVGGSLNLSGVSNTINVDIAPSFGYFITEEISVEGNLGFNFKDLYDDYGLAAVGRYWLPLTDVITYTPGLVLDFNLRDNSIGDSAFNFGLGLQLGSFNYAIDGNWAVAANFCSLNFNRLFNDAYVNYNLSTSTTITVRYFF